MSASCTTIQVPHFLEGIRNKAKKSHCELLITVDLNVLSSSVGSSSTIALPIFCAVVTAQ